MGRTGKKKTLKHLFSTCSIAQVGNQVIPILFLLQSTESHLSSGNVFLRVLEILEQSLLSPDNALLLVGIGVGETFYLSRLTSKQAVQVRTDLIRAAGLEGVALSAAGLEKVCTLSIIAFLKTHVYQSNIIILTLKTKEQQQVSCRT